MPIFVVYQQENFSDFDSYSETIGFNMEPYDAWMPGEIAIEYDQLVKAINNALLGEDVYKEERERFRRITHRYIDGNSTERVLTVAREILFEEL